MGRKKNIFLLLSFLIALCLTCYPHLLRLLYHTQARQSISQFSDFVSIPAEALSEEAAIEADDNLQPELFSDLYGAMQQYNLSIWQNQQADLNSVEDYETPAVDAASYLGTDTVGVISIPAMDVELPLYLGASKANMTKGAVVLGGTSCPIGGENTNCVIAAHRGYSGIPFFREIERLSIGDTITITNPWETLSYAVTEIEIVTPDSLDLVHIQPGRDMVTLVTCHPYRVGTHRYLVYCERTEAKETSSAAHSEAVSGFSASGGVLVSDGTTAHTAPYTESEERSCRLLSREEMLEYAAPVLVLFAWFCILISQGGRRREPVKTAGK